VAASGFIKKTESVQGKNHLPGFNPLSKEEIKMAYTSGLNKILTAIEQGTIQKAVLSRLEFVPGFNLKQAPGILINLFNQYQSAFVYLLHLPGLFTWMGATPEILLLKKDKSLQTIALAGTKERNSDGEIKWSDKEKHEQQLVTDYIEGILADLKLPEYSKSPTYTVKAGQVFHLRTDFEIDTGDDAISFGKIASRLHPTPAVCGFPMGDASEIIKQVEKHDREYYCGFLGPVNLDGESSLYVNLRCLQFMDTGLVIYAGGGITEGSEVENEWNETVQKAGTLLALLEKM
jgi:isochorismate synthase